MISNTSLLNDKILGCLLGGVIGDAVGAPAEGKTYKQIEIAESLMDSQIGRQS